MLKKRIIFCLLYKDGYFVQSRNFITNIIGDTNWIIKNYNFTNISNYIDELIILDISLKKKTNTFLRHVERIVKRSFIPLTLGGGIKDLILARAFLENMSDKILINTSLFENHEIICEISNRYGSQSIIAALDYKYEKNKKIILKNNANIKVNSNFNKILKFVNNLDVGEILINSVDKDGTGQGLDVKLLEKLPKLNKPLILSGGAGNYKHFIDILTSKKVSAILTSNLLNFVGNGLKNLRHQLEKNKIDLPSWN
jgi:cyclase